MPAARPGWPARTGVFVGTLGLGALGGWTAFALAFPLAWMIGAMTVTTVGALAGLPLAVSPRLRAGMIAVLGIMLGSAFTPEIADQMGRWLISLGALAVYVAALTGIVLLYLRRYAGYDPVTAYFAATPGGLNEMTLVGHAMGGDDRIISLVHGARILLIVMTVPFWFQFAEGYAPGTWVGLPLADIGGRDLAVLAVCGVVGVVLAGLLRIPAARLTGPMMLSALAHLTGLTASRPPVELVAIAQVVVGSAIGCRFAGVPVRTVLRTVAVSAGSTVIMLTATVGASLAMAPLSGASVIALVLALAPGGLAEMSLIALSLGIDAAFVSTHHMVRIILVVVFAPVAFRLLRGRGWAGNPKGGGDP